MSKLAVTEHRSLSELEALSPQWDALVDRAPLDPAQEFAWHRTLWAIHEKDRELSVLAVHDGETLVGIFPLVTEREKRAGLPARIIRPLSHFHQVHGTPMIVGEPRAAVMEALFQ